MSRRVNRSPAILCSRGLFGIVSQEVISMMPKKKVQKRTKPTKPAAIKRLARPRSKAQVAGAAQIHQNIFASDWREEDKAPN